MAIAGVRRLAAAGAVTAFAVGGVGMAAGVGTATAQSSPARGHAVSATCEKTLSPCESESGGLVPGDDPWADGGGVHDGGVHDGASSPGESFSSGPDSGDGSGPDSGDDSWPREPSSDESFASIPLPDGSSGGWSAAPGETFSSGPASLPAGPWVPAGEKKQKIPAGAPQTGAGGLVADAATWPFAVGGAALLLGAGLAGFAVRRRAGEA
ncbi:hypothetical protein HS041_24135 [Planomonospora sp. ID67723]|uniref:hypothetical protein n=1 Tax=Planomonospora sp. ID67723 TaxID=2738134 RepID=UPI0018C3A6CF|nr:hypothetical protein [Planomonospora sp. ID67723]MBG0830853.1 hypothetical protein [Planomonospora sp. ID67723]